MTWSEAARREAARVRQERYRARHPERVTNTNRKYDAAHREKRAAYMRAYRADEPEHFRAYNRRAKLKREYGLTEQQYDAMLEAQKGLCAICGVALRRDGKTHVDHCHASGKVRGLLCYRCNPLLGLARDNIQILNRAVDYLTAKQE